MTGFLLLEVSSRNGGIIMKRLPVSGIIKAGYFHPAQEFIASHAVRHRFIKLEYSSFPKRRKLSDQLRHDSQ
ncbi:MAG: hypothetical protein ACWA6R_10935, partial [Nitrosomonas sp.]